MKMPFNGRSWLFGLLGAALVLTAASAHADAVTDWDRLTFETMHANDWNPFLQGRDAALVHVAMFEAINSIERSARPYSQRIPSRPGASMEAAAATAAHRALLGLYPSQQVMLDAALAKSLAEIKSAQARDDGIAVGEIAARQMLAWRADDGINDFLPYRPPHAPGVWVPQDGSTAFGVNLPMVPPWVIRDAAQFRPAPPPAYSSVQFKRDYLEVFAIGGVDSMTRTPEQTLVAQFWTDSGPKLWSSVARQLSAAYGLTFAQNAKLFAQLHMALADSSIACFDAKYTYDIWRPVGAIPTGAGQAHLPAQADWKPAIPTLQLPAQPSWIPVIPTPQFPAYPSAHGCSAGAAAAVLKSEFGDTEFPVTVTLRSVATGDVERRYQRLSEIEADVFNARIWGGIHWRFDQTVGSELGYRVGNFVVANALQPAL